ncbi:MAG TPA: PDZ domain-containing protein, partial [Pyrinomonadaceae bacterium]|nr:PDZ domain-containing protein [Pyrinomonadaceae bacterium]
DIIVSIDGERVKDRNDLFRILDKHQIGDTVQVGLVRNGRNLTVPVRLTATPQQPTQPAPRARERDGDGDRRPFRKY